MKRYMYAGLVSLLGSFLFIGCATQGAQEFDANSVNYELNYQTGTVEHIRLVAIKDNGTGSFVGAITGAILGSMIGHGRGSTLAALGGGLGGAYVGKEVAKANAQELSVVLDNGRSVVVIAKGERFRVGQRVRIVKKGGRVYSVEAF
jgi:outer membrane lipoprotein SlyB